MLSLHYNGDNSYWFVNGRQELKFKAKTDQLVNEKLCIGNLSDQWTASKSEKTGLYGNIYDFVVVESQCDMWCKPGQYLDHKNCVCKNKLIGRVIEECTSVINETMMNNNDNNNDNNFYKIMAYVFIGLFLLAIICFCVFAYFKWFKDKELSKNKSADY